MKKGILCILLSIVLLLPTLASCQQTSDFSETEASIYTLYTIKDDSTNEEAIRQVELALNRILFYRLGVILKLEMVNEDEYDKLIEDKFIEMEEYQLEKKNNKKTESSSEATEGEEVSVDVLSGDDVLKLLENGEEIPLDEPRLDIFLVRGYDNYYNLATDGKLAALDEKLNNEGKALKSSIHSTLFTAAKVGNKTYGVPVNNAIGEYTYLVFDAELLNQHGVDPNTIVSLEDLQDYLELIKANNPDVVPLMNTKESTDINFLSNEGFPALVTPSGTANDVTKAYSNNDFKNFFAMIARYKALGYLGDTSGSEESGDTRYAVRIETGNIDSIEAKLANTGYEYEYSMFSAPLATNETTIDNIFCVSEYVVSNELTDVIEIITAINTDAQLMNILTYGVENEHYVLNDDGQVERLVSEIEDPDNPGQKIDNKYIMNPNYVGNCFITYTLKGENPEKWNNAIKQNQDAIVSPSLGFTSDPTKFTYKVTSETEDPNKPGTMIKEETEFDIYEPDYVEIINTIVDKYYPALLAGTAVEFDYEAIRTQATDEITAEFIDRNDELFEENVLQPMFAELMREEILKKQGEDIYNSVEEEVRQEYFDGAKKSLKNKLTSQFKSENPDASSEDITAMVNEVLTDDYVNEHFYDYYSEEEVQETIDSLYNIQLESAIEDAIDDIEDTAEYEREFQKIKNSEDYLSALNQMLTYDAPSKILSKIDEYIAAEIDVYTENMIAEMETAIEAAVTAFIAENSETLGMTQTEILVEIGYYVEETTEDGVTEDDAAGEDTEGEDTEGEEGEEEEKSYVPAYETWFDFVFEEKLKQVYYGIFGDPSQAA